MGVEIGPDVTGDAVPIRLLFVGDSSAAGVGVDRQDEALAQQVAQHLTAMSGRLVHWQLVAQSGVNTSQAGVLVAQSDLQPADILRTALGVNDVTSQRSPAQFLSDYRQLVLDVMRRAGVPSLIVN